MAELQDDVTGQLHEDREQTQGEALALQLERVFGPGARQGDEVTPQPKPKEEEEVDPGITLSGILKDLARGLVETPRAITVGITKAVNETIDMVDELGDWLEEKVPLGGFEITKDGIRRLSPEELKAKGGADLPNLPQMADPKSTTGKLVSNVSQFLAGFVGAGKLMKGWKAVGTGAKVTKAAAQGAVADFAVWDPHEQRLSDLLQRVPALQNPVTEYLASDPEDSAAEGRFKNAIEGVVPGVLVDGFVTALRAMRNVRMMKQAAKAAGDYKVRVEKEALNVLGDVDAEQLIVTRKPTMPSATEAAAARKTKAAVKESKGVTPGQVLDDSAEPETFINFSRINTAEDVQKVMQRVADLNKKAVDKAKRGVRTWEQTKLSAEQQNAWKTLVNRRRGEPLNAEQALAARQLWASSAEKLTETAKLAAANPSEANLFAFRKMLATHYAVQREVLAARAETARALNSWAIPAGSSEALGKQIDLMLEASGGVKTAQDMAKRIAVLAENGQWDAMEKFVEKGVLAKTSDAVKQVWINALLSNPTTHIVNIMSNYSVVAQQIYERKVANLIGRVLGTKNGVALGETFHMMHGAIEGLKDAMRAGWQSKGRSFLSGDAPVDLLGATNKIEIEQGALRAEVWNMQKTPLGGVMNVIDTVTRAPGRLLQAGDEWFKSIGYRMELHAQAARMAAAEVNSGAIPKSKLKARIAEIIENPPEHIKLEAVDAALYNTFTQKPAEVLDGVARAWQRLPVLGRLTMPFRRTPINILTYVAERSPFAPLVKEWRADVAAGGARADIALARVATGTMLMAAVMDLALNGQITGSAPTEAGARDNFKRQGKQEYSIKVGDTWYSFSRADPVGMTLGMAADIADIAMTMDGNDDAYEDLFIHSSLALAKNVTSKTYMEGMAGVFEVLSDPDRYAKGRAGRIIGSFIPAGVAAVTRQIDPYLRTANDMTDALKRRIPYWSKDLPLYRDLWGREVNYQSGFGRVYDLLSPIYVRHENPEPIDSELDRIEYYPEMPSRQFQYKGVTLDLERHPHAYSRYVELAGNGVKHPAWGMGAKDLLNAIVEGRHALSPVYRLYSDGPDGGKAAFIRKTLQDYRELAKEQVVREFDELQVEYEFQRQRNPYGSEIAPEILGLR